MGILDPGIAYTDPFSPYLPFLAPKIETAANAAAAPQRCTTPDPAKSV